MAVKSISVDESKIEALKVKAADAVRLTPVANDGNAFYLNEGVIPKAPAPSIQAPSIQAPSIQAPSLSPPSITAPSIQAPSLSIPVKYDLWLDNQKQMGFLKNIGKGVGILLDGVSADHTIIGKFGNLLQGKEQKAQQAQKVTLPPVNNLASLLHPSVGSPAQSAAFLPQINKIGGNSTPQKWYEKIPVWGWVLSAVGLTLGIMYLFFSKRRR